MMRRYPMSPPRSTMLITLADAPRERILLSTLPYDLLLNIAQYLDLEDIHAMQLTCRSLYDSVTTRPVYRNLAVALLRRCRALPLSGFQRLSDLSTEQLVSAVTKANGLEIAWLTRAPRPSTTSPYVDDWDHAPDGMSSEGSTGSSWYRVISAPPNEEVDWLSPITSSYSLCATKSGKVICWDVHRDFCLAEWDPQERWELWKCRVEFDIRTVFFTMAKVLRKPYDDRLMEFVLMRLEFPDNGAEVLEAGEGNLAAKPTFTKLASFKTVGVVMNVFLLDPLSRLLSAFVWVSKWETIGLYALLDWDKDEYVFIDTGIYCSASSNWSCILYQGQIVIHSEECDYANQYFYPLSQLQHYSRPSSNHKSFVPSLSARVSPSRTMTAPFVFPSREEDPSHSTSSSTEVSDEITLTNGPDSDMHDTATAEPLAEASDNPFPYPPWYPESAHFVRQWWPTLPHIPRLSCTVVLLADHYMDSVRMRYVLAQHYFRVPLFDARDAESSDRSQSEGDVASGSGSASDSESTVVSLLSKAGAGMESTMKIWYVDEPFEVVCVLDGVDDDEDGQAAERPRPLMAVDFGHAVWVEYAEPGGTSEKKRLRFVSFPPVANEREGSYTAQERAKDAMGDVRGVVRTLETPPELDLDQVETINIDQSQGAVIISVKEKEKEGRIFILYYE